MSNGVTNEIREDPRIPTAETVGERITATLNSAEDLVILDDCAWRLEIVAMIRHCYTGAKVGECRDFLRSLGS